jgi:HTH-type transcriptional regulator, glycine betaine synthesis regulator
MADNLAQARDNLIQELGRLSAFAGFNKAMGQIYGLLYLSAEPISLGEIAVQLGISKGNASLNMQTMERWGLINPVSKKGDRRDYYQAETDFWKIAQGIISGRDEKEIERTVDSITNICESVRTGAEKNENAEQQFIQERLENMVEFGNATSQMIQAFINMGNIRNSRVARSKPEKSSLKHIKIEE